MSEKEFTAISQLIYHKFGIYLPSHKRSFLTNRLAKLWSDSGHSSWSDYFNSLMTDENSQGISDFVNSITTNHTYFYREEKHFHYFSQTVLPEMTSRLSAEGHNDLRIWCAGCSSGEEAYTILMFMLEYFGDRYDFYNAGLLATDISEKALTTARHGVYNTERISSLPAVFRQKYFQRAEMAAAKLSAETLSKNTSARTTAALMAASTAAVPLPAPECWQVIDLLRRQITFRRFNLMSNFPFRQPFHVIFCRNVMIYFDQETKTKLINNFFSYLVTGGYLFIGHSESLGQNSAVFKYVAPSVYQKI